MPLTVSLVLCAAVVWVSAWVPAGSYVSRLDSPASAVPPPASLTVIFMLDVSPVLVDVSTR
jgi:hypothetical protein